MKRITEKALLNYSNEIRSIEQVNKKVFEIKKERNHEL